MRKSLWIISAVLFTALVAPNAAADAYTYSFVGAATLAGTTFVIVDPAGPLAGY